MTKRTLLRVSAAVVCTVAALASAAVAAPAHARPVPAAAGYVWAYRPAVASYTVPITGTYGGTNDYYYAANSGNGPITITRSSAGTYRVRFGGLGALLGEGGGVVHAQAYGATANLCTVGSWYPSGADLLVNVHCFGGDGAKQDTTFVANFVEAQVSNAESGVSYLWAEQPNAASYVPASWYRFDPAGTPSITRDGAGSYRVYLPASAGQTELTFYEVTAYTSAAVSCKVAGYLGGGVARVHCRNAVGSLVDSRFTITWTIFNLLQRIAPTSIAAVHNTYPSDTTPAITWTSDSNLSHEFTVTRYRTGFYEMFFPQIIDYSGHAVAHATGYQGARCAIAGWYPSGSADMRVAVYCVNSSGAAVDTPFVVAFTW